MIITTSTAALLFIIINIVLFFAYFMGKLKSEVDFLKNQIKEEITQSNEILNLEIEIIELERQIEYYYKIKN